MESILHPISGEQGFFCTNEEKVLIDAIIQDFSMNQLVVQESSHSNVRGVESE